VAVAARIGAGVSAAAVIASTKTKL